MFFITSLMNIRVEKVTRIEYVRHEKGEGRLDGKGKELEEEKGQDREKSMNINMERTLGWRR